MAKGTCQIEGCERDHYARGWCVMHYNRWRSHGDPLHEGPTSAERFWAKVNVRGPDECWSWPTPDSRGYGGLSFEGRQRKVHHVAYELGIGPIPKGLTIDHTCHNRDLSCAGGHACPHRRCCNPAHLEAVSHAVNVARGRAGSHHAAKTHCPQGHPYSGVNLRIYAGSRFCRACSAAASRASRAARAWQAERDRRAA